MSNESTALVKSLIEQLPAILMALAACIAAIGSIAGYRQGRRNGALLEVNNEKTDSVLVKTDQIHDATNGGMKKLKTEAAEHKVQLAEAVALIAELRAVIKGRE